jgi:hypothetical protein
MSAHNRLHNPNVKLVVPSDICRIGYYLIIWSEMIFVQ